MRLHSARAFVAILATLAVFFTATAASADQYPARQITIVVPYTPGGTVDLLARVIGARITKDWGQQVIIDNRPGAGGSVGAAFAAKAAADGYTLLLTTSSPLTTNMALYHSIGYDALRDFAPIYAMAASNVVIAVNPHFAAKSVADLIKIAKAKPGELTAANSGNGSSAHLATVQLDRRAGINIRPVAYRGGVPSLTAAMSGEVPIVFSDLVPALPFIRAGKLRAIAVTTARRDLVAPTLPTLAESGFPGFDISSWLGLVAPTGTPSSIVQKLNVEVNAILHDPSLHKQMLDLDIRPMNLTPAQFEAFLRAEVPRWARMVRQAHLTIQ